MKARSRPPVSVFSLLFVLNSLSCLILPKHPAWGYTLAESRGIGVRAIAMGGGTQLAQASADMILLSDHLRVLPQAVRVAQQTRKIIKQNLSWAIGYNALALPLAAAGWIQPWMAAIGMSASSLLVVLNALRLRDSGGDRLAQAVSLADEHRVERVLP